MPDSEDNVPENTGQQILEHLGMLCIHRLHHVRLGDIDPLGSYSRNEHLEFDYLIPFNEICIIGEITDRSGSRDVEKKYQRFRRSYNFVAGQPFEERLWRLLGVPDVHIPRFRNVAEVRGFYISTRLQRYDVKLSEVLNIARFYRADWELLRQYSECVGRHAQSHFLSLFDVPSRRGRRPIEIPEATRIRYKKVVSGSVGTADLYTFEASPFELLPLAKVYRSDLLPDLSPDSPAKYQRALIPGKLEEIRRDVLTDTNFMFPNSILVVLSSDCSYNAARRTLLIPEQYGSIEVIDGQHRLFSYADEQVEKRCGVACRIMVTGVQFQESDRNAAYKYSAKTFIEINTNQTTVKRSHVDAIRYPLLGETQPRAIAAQIIWQANETPGAVYGLFDTSQTSLGIIQTTTVLTALKSLTNLEAIGKLVTGTRGVRARKRRGYEQLFDATIVELIEPEVLINKGKVCLVRYFNLVKTAFNRDWPRREQDNRSSLRFAKMIAAFVRLLGQFISEGLDWTQVKQELESIKSNVMQLRSLQRYDRILFDPDEPQIPDAAPSPADDYRFLNRNRRHPTAISRV